LGYFAQHGDLLRCRAQGLGAHETLQRFLLAYHADAARNALATRFVTKETGNPQQDLAKIHCVVK
jgi:hypothetical protein